MNEFIHRLPYRNGDVQTNKISVEMGVCGGDELNYLFQDAITETGLIVAVEWIVGIFATAIVGLITYFVTKRHFTRVDIERARSAKRDIESTLSRSIIQHGLNPSLTEIQRIINSKSREYNVRPNQIARPEEIIEDIYAKTIETEFILPTWKKRILTTLDKILAVKPKLRKLELAQRLEEERRRIRLTFTISAALAAISALLFYVFTLLISP